jgi:hypothetical protein
MVLFLTELRGVTLIQKLPHKYFQIGRWLVMIVNIPLLIVVVFFRPAEESTAFFSNLCMKKVIITASKL